MYDGLDARMVGRDIKHIGGSVSGREQVDDGGDSAAKRKERERAQISLQAVIRKTCSMTEKPDENQQDMPAVSVQSQRPVDMGKALRDCQGGNAAHDVKVSHESADYAPEPAVAERVLDQAQIHGYAAQLKGEIPPVVASMVYENSQKNLFIKFANGESQTGQKEDPACGGLGHIMKISNY